MVAALLRTLHSGIQDSRLLPPRGQPDISLFSKVLNRTGRFTTQWVRLDFDTRPTLGAKFTITLPTKGHLISKLYLVTTMPDIETPQATAQAAAGLAFAGPKFAWTNSLGHALLQQASIEIGGARVEQIDGRLLEVLDEFYTPLERLELANRLLGRNPTNFPQFSEGPTTGPKEVITPLSFWFSRGDPGVFLPIDALAADAVRLSVTFASLDSLYVSDARVTINPADPLCRVKGGAYPPLAGSPFYVLDPAGKPVAGLNGDPTTTQLVSPIPNAQIPVNPVLGDTYILAEYVYLDAPEANRFRISDIEVPVVQHYAFEPHDSFGAPRASIPLRIPNPTRNLLFFCQRYEAPNYNAPFLATRDLSGADAPVAPWWPNAAPVSARYPGRFQPGFQFRDSEPLSTLLLTYEGKMDRYAALSPSLFRTIFPAYEMKKAPYINRYYYSLHFGLGHGRVPFSQPSGEANLDKVTNITLDLEFKPFRGCTAPTQVPRYTIYVWAETYNVFRVYGGRGGMLFAF